MKKFIKFVGGPALFFVFVMYNFLNMGLANERNAENVQSEVEEFAGVLKDPKEKKADSTDAKNAATPCKGEDTGQEEEGGTSPLTELKNSASSEISLEEEQRLISGIEGYLGGIHTLLGNFSQLSTSKGKVVSNQSGRFIMRRPKGKTYKIRIDLQTQRMVIKDEVLMIWENGKVSKQSVASTPIANIFAEKFKLKDFFKNYTIVYFPKESVICVDLTCKNAMSLSLFFSLYEKKKSVQTLLGWRVKDVKGVETNVVFEKSSVTANNEKMVPANAFDINAELSGS
jgi:hypothetical protein